ncbi:hypothetical protein GCM10009117_19060 [Gangjinia marincola]|uniref:Uncharacterized protein n=1 Tax=Gangjinia marincola TaxID=578463 RepID=A0ABP3XWL5_9FLAO
MNKGLYELENSREIYKKINDEVSVQKIGFFKLDDNSYRIAIMLNDDITPEVIKKYSFGIHLKLEGDQAKFMPDGKSYLSWDFQPELHTFNDHKYIIREVNTPVRYIKKMRLFLYNRGKYKERYGDNIFITRVSL